MKIEITSGWNGNTIAELGEADGWNDAASIVKKWVLAMRGMMYAPVWTFTRMVSEGCFVVDFGSHMFFARYRGEPR